jgi:putative DNA primase/helicase
MHHPSESTGATLSTPDSEQQLLAAVLDDHADWLPALCRIIQSPEAFVDPDRRCLWETLLEMHSRGEAISMDSVAVVMRRENRVPDEDTRFLLLIETHAIFRLPMAEWHARQIAYAHARRLLATAGEMAEHADAGPQEMAAILRDQLKKLDHIAYSSGEDAPRPLPLGGALLPVKPFSTDWLPAPFRPWISDIAERMQCPPEFPAVAAMAALSSVAGRRFCIQPKELDDSYTEFPHLWAMLIGSPSLMKSPAMQSAMRPLREMERIVNKEHACLMGERQVEEIASRIKRGALEAEARKAAKNNNAFDYALLIDPAETEPPPLRRFIVNNPSLEALGEVLRDNPTGTLLYQDELAGLLALLEKEGNQSLRAFLLQSWSGKEPFTFDRIVRGLRHVEACVLSLLGSIQPGVIAAHVRAANGNTAGADGFLQRFSLMVWPDVNPHWVDIDRPLCRESEWEAADVFNTFENVTHQSLLKNGVQANRDNIPTFHFAPAAQELFNDWRRTLELRLRQGGMTPAIEAHLGKYRKLVPALALLIHAAEIPGGQVSLSAVERALAFTDCLESHAHRVFASGSVAESAAVHTLLKKLCDGSGGLPENFKARDVRNKCWSGLVRSEDAESACEVLAEHRWLIATTKTASSQGGRPTTTYHLNPQAKNAFDPSK